jgi:hypothetical protein
MKEGPTIAGDAEAVPLLGSEEAALGVGAAIFSGFPGKAETSPKRERRGLRGGLLPALAVALRACIVTRMPGFLAARARIGNGLTRCKLMGDNRIHRTRIFSRKKMVDSLPGNRYARRRTCPIGSVWATSLSGVAVFRRRVSSPDCKWSVRRAGSGGIAGRVDCSQNAHNPLHDGTIQIVSETLQRRLPAGWVIRIQSAITTADSEPEPDVAIVRGDARTYLQRHPGPGLMKTVHREVRICCAIW